ncbi:MAG: peroxiredoxin Q/BCP [Patiriisocius sp.]
MKIVNRLQSSFVTLQVDDKNQRIVMESGVHFLEENNKSPFFEGINQNEEAISIDGFKGKRLILFFYPKDSTPGCTLEVQNLRDNFLALKEMGYEVLGVSADSVSRHKKFIEKHNLPFDLLADEQKVIINDYGVWGEKKFMGKVYDGIHRTTFIINEEGVIESIIKKVKTKEHAQQIFALTK